MAHRTPTQPVETGVVVDPRDVMDDFNTLVQEMNGYLDGNNVGYLQVTAAKIANEAFVYLFDNPQAAINQTIPQGDAGVWSDVTLLSTTIDVDDGEVQADAHINVTNVVAVPHHEKCAAQLIINGVVVGVTGWVHQSRIKTVLFMTGSLPVPAGTATISVQVRHWSDVWVLIDDVNNGTGNPSTVQAYNPAYTQHDLVVASGNVVGYHRKA